MSLRIRPSADAENIFPLVAAKPIKTSSRTRQRFQVRAFTNRSGTASWRITGVQRDGVRVRENFVDLGSAQCRQLELETKYLTGHSVAEIQQTRLTPDQLRVAESAMTQLGEDWPLIIDAITWWKRHGKQRIDVESPRIDEAVDDYLVWLEASAFREATKRHWKIRMNVFKNSVSNIRVSDITPEFIEQFLNSRKVSAAAKDTDRRAVSRFLSWCIERPRRWTLTNSCRDVKVEMGEKPPPQIYTLAQCEKLLRAAESFKKGRCVRFIVLCLFGKLRPSEAVRVRPEQINLKDNELRLEANQTKTGRKSGRPRVITICPTLKRWLIAFPGEIYPKNFRKDFDHVKQLAGFGTPTKDRPQLLPWIDDGLRHTGISHFFRKTESYGKTAEESGNSEAIIKKHYQGRVNSDDTKKFYSLSPKR